MGVQDGAGVVTQGPQSQQMYTSDHMSPMTNSVNGTMGSDPKVCLVVGWLVDILFHCSLKNLWTPFLEWLGAGAWCAGE